MKTEHQTQDEDLKIPLDILLDVLTVIVREELAHEVIRVIANRSQVIINVKYETGAIRAQKAVANIKTLLSDYQHYRSWEAEELNWRED